MTTDSGAGNPAVAAILTQPDDEGRQHPAVCESRKLTAALQRWCRAEPGASPGAAGGGPRPVGVPTVPARRRGAPAGGVLDGFWPADGQPGDHVAQAEPASEQDARLLRPQVRRDRGLSLRRDAPARGRCTQPDGPAVAARIRRRRRPRAVDGRLGTREPAGALVAVVLSPACTCTRMSSLSPA